ncbi:MAG: glutathione S-transferase family protein [Gammaproteobacteria bacterium]
MTLKFYMTPGSCSTGIHVLLEEAGLVFEAYSVNLLAGDQNKADYLAINPKGTIPALVREDGSVLTEFQSIAWWLAKNYPRRKLLPEDLDGEVRVLEWMNYAVNTLHGQGFARIFTTDKFTADKDDHEAVKAQGRGIVDRGFALVDDMLSGREFVAERFGIADAALLYVEFWADRIGIPLPENVDKHYRRLLTRPAVKQVLMEEGYASVYR